MSSFVFAMDAPCYGLGKLIGMLDTVLESDMDLVVLNNIGGSKNYLDSIEYFLDGKNYFQIKYKSSTNKTVQGTIHGADPSLKENLFTLTKFEVG